jgi:hypothetical protein
LERVDRHVHAFETECGRIGICARGGHAHVRWLRVGPGQRGDR